MELENKKIDMLGLDREEIEESINLDFEEVEEVEEVPNLNFEEVEELEDSTEIPNLYFEEENSSLDWNYRQHPDLMTKQELYDIIYLVNSIGGKVEKYSWLSFNGENEILALKESVSINYDLILKRPSLHKLITNKGDFGLFVAGNLPLIMILSAKLKGRFSVSGFFKGFFKKKGKK